MQNFKTSDLTSRTTDQELHGNKRFQKLKIVDTFGVKVLKIKAYNPKQNPTYENWQLKENWLDI